MLSFCFRPEAGKLICSVASVGRVTNCGISELHRKCRWASMPEEGAVPAFPNFPGGHTAGRAFPEYFSWEQDCVQLSQ
jgi:hypothetical protein